VKIRKGEEIREPALHVYVTNPPRSATKYRGKTGEQARIVPGRTLYEQSHGGCNNLCSTKKEGGLARSLSQSAGGGGGGGGEKRSGGVCVPVRTNRRGYQKEGELRTKGNLMPGKSVGGNTHSALLKVCEQKVNRHTVQGISTEGMKVGKL